MTEIIMKQVQEKLSKSREMCPGLSNEVYALTDYMAKVTNDTVMPREMATLLELVLRDISRGKNGFSEQEDEHFEYLKKNQTKIFEQAVYVPQIIDAIADKDFSNEFRRICEEELNFDLPKKGDIEGDYPDYVKAAVNWWADAIGDPKFDNGDPEAGAFVASLAMQENSKSSISKEQIELFKKELAQLVMVKMDLLHNSQCYLEVDYHPDTSLYIAASKAGIDTRMRFPWKTQMIINKERVTVSAGDAAPWKTIWKKKH